MVTYRIDWRNTASDEWQCYDDNLTDNEAWHHMQEFNEIDECDPYHRKEWRMVRVETTETVVDTVHAIRPATEATP